MNSSYILIALLLFAVISGSICVQQGSCPSLTANQFAGRTQRFDIATTRLTLTTPGSPGRCDVARSDFFSCVLKEAKRYLPQPGLPLRMSEKADRMFCKHSFNLLLN